MKKTYSKPQIVFDSFELSQSIAGACEAITNQAKGSCPLHDKESDMTLFAGKECEFIPPTTKDEICYDVPYENYNVFSS